MTIGNRRGVLNLKFLDEKISINNYKKMIAFSKGTEMCITGDNYI